MAEADQDRARLFEPATLGPVTLRNRIVMAPMTRNRAGEGDVPQAMNVEYYRQRSSAGLIVTEASQVSVQGRGYMHTPGCHDEAQVIGWRKVTDAVHASGGRIFLQLWHVGGISHPSFQPGGGLPVAPSAVLPAGNVLTPDGLLPYVAPRALAIDEIPGIVGQFRNAAVQARIANFDGVELHAANGYLIDQFLRDGTNLRDDSYGGPPENRARLLRETIDAVAEVWGSGRVGVRLSPASGFNDMRDSNPEALFAYVAEMLSDYRLAYLHIVEESALPDFDWSAIRRAYRGTYMVNGGYDRKRALDAVAEGRADLISFGKAFISNPDLVARLERDAELSPGDRSTFYGGSAEGYIDYPALAAA